MLLFSAHRNSFSVKTLKTMDAKILSIIKPIKISSNFFGFLPFCLSRNDKNYKKFLIISYIYSVILVLILVFTMYYVINIIAKYGESFFMPKKVHQTIEIWFIVVSIMQSAGIFSRTMSDIFDNFCEIDDKVQFITDSLTSLPTYPTPSLNLGYPMVGQVGISYGILYHP